jgi:hypothetical protein
MLQAGWRDLLREQESPVTISNLQLREAFLTPQLQCYFEKKLADVTAGEVLVRIEEALKFLNIAVYTRGSIPVTEEIDDIWHYWILQTREYEVLCESLQGRTFIHHTSHVFAECAPESTEVAPNALDEDVEMLASYVRNYGPMDSDRIKYWRLAKYLVDTCGMTVDQLNEWLSSAPTPANA